MIKALKTGLALVMIASTLTVAAQASSRPGSKSEDGSRTIEVRYDGGAVPYATCLDCPNLTAKPGEKYITVEVFDDLSPRGFVDVAWTIQGSKDPGYVVVCGETSEPQRIPPSADLTIYPWVVPSQGCTGGFSTTGTVRITFTRDR